MFPVLSDPDGLYCALANTELRGKNCIRERAISYFNNGRFYEKRGADLFATSLSLFAYLVRLVVLLRAKKKMVGVTASAYIALVAHEHTVWYWSVFVLPHDPMDQPWLFLSMNADLPMRMARPKP